MPRTEKKLLPLNLVDYDVYIEDRTENSDYFQISKLPALFTGGKNSFLINGSALLQEESEILIEILDSNKNTIYQTVVANYTQADGKLISVEIYPSTPVGPCYIIIMGKASITTDGTEIPSEWKNTYNVRWIKQVLTDYDINNTSQIIFQDNPIVTVKENRFLNLLSSSYVERTGSVSASLTPTTTLSVQSGYAIRNTNSFILPNYINPVITGSITINNITNNIYLPLTKILNNKTGYTYNNYIYSPVNNNIIRQMVLRSGSYVTNIEDTAYPITTSVKLQYFDLLTSSTNIPISYANLRVSKLGTVSGELYKIKVYNKVASSVSNYKLIADVQVTAEELLITSSNKGFLSIGNITQTPVVSQNWYAGQLTKNTGQKPLLYPVSGSSTYYDSTVSSLQFNVSSSNDVLFTSFYADVPVTASSPLQTIPTTNLTSSLFQTQVSESGYFIGTKEPVDLFSSTEYTLQLDAYYKNMSESVYLNGITPKVDIYIIGVNGTKVVSENPLGQRIGQLTGLGDTQWFEQKQFNFSPNINNSGKVGLRFVVSNGFWYFSNVSLKPATDPQFSPDEVQILIPNTEYFNELLEYKVEFFDINNNSAPVTAVSIPTYFTGSAIDLGTIP